jgi:peptidoglycan/LPS O-acetylase OafA/YrhL
MERVENWALGNIGVATFFSLSGFLVYYVLANDEKKFGYVDYNFFLLRRVIRIWPAYFLTIATASWYFLELPFLRLKERLTPNSVAFGWPTILIWSALLTGALLLATR